MQENTPDPPPQVHGNTPDPPRPSEAERLAAEVLALRDTNRKLNRRANAQDSYWQGRAMSAERDVGWMRDRWKPEFDRMCRAHNELRDVYLSLCEKEGLYVPKFHSVMDSNVEEGQRDRWDPPGVFANVYTCDEDDRAVGPVKSERVSHAVRRVLGLSIPEASDGAGSKESRLREA